MGIGARTWGRSFRITARFGVGLSGLVSGLIYAATLANVAANPNGRWDRRKVAGRVLPLANLFS
jgi:hypothetical protein